MPWCPPPLTMQSTALCYLYCSFGEVSFSLTTLCRIILCDPSDFLSSSSFPEGRACAVVFDCKFIETSAAVQHNVKELFEGIVRQVRLRRDSKEKNERRLAYQKRRESIPRKARRFWGKIVAKNNKNMAFKLKSKSCHDLSVL